MLKKPFLLCIWLFVFGTLHAQHSYTLRILSKDELQPIEGATAVIESLQKTASADSTGALKFDSLAAGEYAAQVSHLGYFRKRVKFNIPAKQVQETILLEPQDEELEEVVVVSTRMEKIAEEQPTRIEVVTEEEVEERSHDKPSDMSHIVREQTGVQVQRTSATGGTMTIRLQGLRGKYSQLLRDGFPLFGGFANSIVVMQIPPLNLKQVEILKGPSSVLYGGDAVAGVINLISKMPDEKPVYDLMVNGESARAVDAGAFCSQRWKWFGFTLTGLYRYQREKDWDGDNFSETPLLQRYYISPQLFFDIGKHITLNAGANYSFENRTGGAIPYLQGKDDPKYRYFEKNVSNHLATNFKWQYNLGNNGKLTLKNAFNRFERELTSPGYRFGGLQLGSLTEINYTVRIKKHEIVAGLDLRTDKFTEVRDTFSPPRDYNFITGGLFANYLYHLTGKTSLEGGFRIDYNNRYGVYPLPHLGIKHKWNEVFLTRVNAGMGYKLPTVFQDESEQLRFINVLPAGDSLRPDLSVGGTVDLLVKLPNYNGLNVTINQLYFINHLFKPLLPGTKKIANCTGPDCENLYYYNIKGYQQTRGIETSLHVNYRGLGASFSYTLTDNNLRTDGVRSIAPLTSKHIVSLLVGYESKWFSAGIDCYYYSPIKYSDGSVGQRIWEFGINTQLSLRYVLIFANLENLFDIRQTNFGPIVFAAPTLNQPRFKEIYAPLEGRLLNAGIKLRLGEFGKKARGDGIEKLKQSDDD